MGEVRAAAAAGLCVKSTDSRPADTGVFVLSCDPAYDLFRLGDEMGFKPGTKLKYMALEGRDGPRAQKPSKQDATLALLPYVIQLLVSVA
jgi:dynein heavy chain